MTSVPTADLRRTVFGFGAGASRLAIALFAAISAPVVAQEAAEAQSSVAAADAVSDMGSIEEILVTARRRTESLQDVPISVAALQGETIADRNIVQLQDLAAYIPNFRQTNGSIGTFKFIRGAGSGSNLSFEQAVGTFFDDVYAGRSQESRIPFFDIERVEVLRGPQVLLYGNSTIGGAVSVISRKPGDEFELDLDGSYEFEHNELIARGGVSVPVAPGFSLRIAGMSQTLDRGWLTSLTNGEKLHDPRFDNQAGRIIAVVEPSDDFVATLKYERSNLKVLGNTLQPISNALNSPAIIEAKFDRRRVVGQPAPLGIGAPTGIEEEIMRMKPQVWLANLEYSPSDVTITSTTALSKYNFFQSVEGDLSPLAVFNFAQRERYRQFSQELRLAGEAGSIEYMVGGYYQDDRLRASGFTDVNLAALGTPVPPFARRNDFSQDTTSWSAFADLTWSASDQLRFGVGARYTEIDKTVDQIYRSAQIASWVFDPTAENLFVPPLRTTLFQFAFGNPHEFNDIKLSENHFMPQATVEYDVAPDVLLFAKAVRGAKAGGVDWLYSGADRDEAIFRPEKATSFEAGMKSFFADRTFNLNVTAYYTDFDDLQVSIFNGSTNFVVGNAAKSRSKGVEAEAVWRATPQLTLSTALAYLDSTYVRFPGAGCTFEQRAALPAGAPCTQDLSGRETPYSSKWSGTAGIEYVQPVGDYEVTGRVDASFRSKYNPSLNDDPFVDQDGLTLVDARLEFGPADGPWSIALFGKNLTDKLYTDQTSDTPIISGSRFATTNRTRQIGVQGRISF